MTHPKGDAIELLRPHLKPGAVAVDVGANVGTVTKVMLDAVRPLNGSVLAIEPDARAYSVLASVCSDAVCLCAALSDTSGQAPLIRGTETTRSSLYLAAKPVDIVTVNTMRLDDIVWTHADVVKIDAQGAEAKILRGAPRHLALCPVWVVELWPAGLHAAGDTAADVVRLLTDAGLTVRWADGALCTVEDVAAWEQAGQQQYVNVTAIREAA